MSKKNSLTREGYCNLGIIDKPYDRFVSLVMLTFLRNIRKSLIKSGSTRKYMIYAIGEITLVVIGILIALQINNWNEKKKDDRLVSIYVKNLISDIVKDTSRIHQFIVVDYKKEKRTENYYTFLKEGNVKPMQLKDSIDRMRIHWKEFDSNKSTFQDLLSTGNLTLLNEIQRKAIIEYYELMEYLEKLLDKIDDSMYQEKNKAEQYLNTDFSQVDFYKALKMQRDHDYLVQGLKHKHNLVEFEKESIFWTRTIGPLINAQARETIKILSK